MPRLDEDTKRLLKSVIDHFDDEDIATRERQLRRYRRLKLYWNNFSRIYYSEVAADYRIAGLDSAVGDSDDQAYYDRPMNVFRAFLETLIAALSIQIPAIVCVPDDADNPQDLSTAKAGNIISELVYKQNDVIFLWLYALYVYCTEGMIACHTYNKTDKKYGTYEEKKYEDEEVERFVCPNCGTELPEEAVVAPVSNMDSELPSLVPDEDDREVEEEEDEEIEDDENDDFTTPIGDEDLNSDILQLEGMSDEGTCPNCGAPIDPNMAKTKLKIPRYMGTVDKPKSRVCIEVHGGLFVKVANYAQTQAQTPYLFHSYETHWANALEWFPDIREDLPKSNPGASIVSGDNDPYEQQCRLNTQYLGEFPQELVTIKSCWLRHAAFNILQEDDAKKLKAKYKDGAKVILVADKIATAESEDLDEHWTLSKNPLSDYLTHDPLGELLTNVQDIINDLISLTLQTIEHGITQTWADPAVVNFNAQQQIEAMPGTLTPTKTVSGGRTIKDAFFSSTTASLSPEVFNFYRIIQELGQFVSGALPSLFGGAQIGKTSGTASEYAMSKGMAMQRLQTPWKMMTIWWKTIFSKVIPMYMENIKVDERIVNRDEKGNFLNVFIRKAELGGKIGSVELENADKLPVSDEQKADIIMQLMQVNNMEIQNALMSPDNLPFIRKTVKIPEFKLPGEDDRQKQLEEINLLITQEPIELPPDIEIMMGADPANLPPPMEVSSVEIDPDVDNHQIEAAVCRSWLVGAAGRLAKIENPSGYKNVMLHMKAHIEQIQITQPQVQPESGDEDVPASETKSPSSKKDKSAPTGGAIEKESNVSTPIQ